MPADDQPTREEIEAARVAAMTAGKTDNGDNAEGSAKWKDSGAPACSSQTITDLSSGLAAFLQMSQDGTNKQNKSIPNLEALLSGTPYLRVCATTSIPKTHWSEFMRVV
ncbi:hypothetical protein Pmar_PMAR007448 [Perkinsus marinus ATCC 50983]|uniref:Uncharacterized protein n=1 Tax=Perkinsus marinus (strain ATCC 50983 / TXsc) TaxID=423536 RepID=C5L984_PERM5|nr:hypothetical protein Pmar_PMAR007448 [Perkinsus marinus ATCC 50983]EER06732.1 hypothetical protein Pmar_PMAR007448 [Perkinsus marinus ATCC 50983]|eukprot:XP_002774916.1 hypothetical protein Pmar_PMAR007448 [Perkinsus marinus ATCC 50983]